MQVDWVSGSIAAPVPLWDELATGAIIQLEPGGVLRKRWAARMVAEHFHESEEGSWSRKFTVRCANPGLLAISGNPVKLLQGHNLWGSCDAVGLFLEAGLFVREHVGLFPGPETWGANHVWGPKFTRLDLTRSYRFPSRAIAQAWIRDVAGAARSRHGAAKLYGDGTAVWGEGSRRWMFKVYDKQGEMLALKKRAHFVTGLETRDLLDWAAGVVRFELQLRTMELEENAVDVAKLRGPDASAAALRIWKRYYDRITFNENAAMTNPDLLEATLPAHLSLKLSAWRGGADLRDKMSKASFYRVRRDLLAAVGVDVASPPPKREASPVSRVPVVLDEAGWDPEPIASRVVDPRAELAESYRLL